MRPLHIALAFFVVAIWGSNFVIIKIGLRDFPPLFFATLRFAFSALPWLLFIRRPPVAWKWLVLFGVFLGAGQFGLLYLAMRADISPGLASLVVQTQVFFTIGLSVWLFGERVSLRSWGGIMLAALGLGVIASHLDASVTAAGIGLVLAAAFFWACANIVVKKAVAQCAVKFNMVAFIVWSSLFAVPPVMLLSFIFEGVQRDWQAISTAHTDAWIALGWQAVGNTLFGYAAWNWLLTRYHAAVITPYALLVPVFGMGSSIIFLGEDFPAWKLVAAILVGAGLAIIMLTPVIPSSKPNK